MVQADGGNFDISTSSTETDTSTKGIKAQKYVILKDGTYQLATADDGIHCNGKYMSAEALIPLIREMMESMQMTRPLYWMGKLI